MPSFPVSTVFIYGFNSTEELAQRADAEKRNMNNNITNIPIGTCLFIFYLHFLLFAIRSYFNKYTKKPNKINNQICVSIEFENYAKLSLQQGLFVDIIELSKALVP